MQVALTIAGSDSGGGAGIQADLKTFHAYGVFGTSAITAVTAQNTRGVTAVHMIPADIVRAQIRAVARDLLPAACKTGMLGTREIVEAVADALRAEALPLCVVDPVMVASSGDRLLDPSAERTIIEKLLPMCTVVTPNIDEVRILTGMDVGDVTSMESAARRLVEMGARAALVKGGHLEAETVTDVLFDGKRMFRWRQPKQRTRHTHGTGCTLSAALAAGLALGMPLEAATARAIAFVQRAIATAPDLGEGNGPLNHRVDPFTIPAATRDSP